MLCAYPTIVIRLLYMGMAPFEALYGKSCKSSIYWDEVGDRKLLGRELVQVTIKVMSMWNDETWSLR